jgi:predicted DCC family thiol-disulfide oxidoreductase YuxK
VTPAGRADRAPATLGTHVLFFDGVCGLCNRLVQFVLARDRRRAFRFAPLQGGFAARELAPRGARPADLETLLVLTAEGDLLRKSRAVVFVLRELGGGWGAVARLAVLPAVLLDRAYDLVARTRYRLFGRLEACRVPTASERERFIED